MDPESPNQAVYLLPEDPKPLYPKIFPLSHTHQIPNKPTSAPHPKVWP